LGPRVNKYARRTRALAQHVCLLAACCLGLPLGALADNSPLPLWQIDGERNSVYLLGSVHLLREDDYPLPKALYAAYEDAEVLLMELDMDDLDPAAAQALITELGVLPAGRGLADILGEETYSEAARLAEAAEVPLAALTQTEPWLAAITVEQVVLQRAGFDPNFGIEAHFSAAALKDGKQILGLEELAEQLGFLDGLSADAQRSLLLQTLSEVQDVESTMDGMVNAWLTGDIDYLQDNMLEQMQAYPELYEAIVAKRNRRWAGQIDALLDDDDDYLIIVGALHLIGEDSVQDQLAARGWHATQMRR